MGRSRHRDAVPRGVLAVTAALVLSGSAAVVLVGVASGTPLRIGLVLCVLIAVAAGCVALLVGRRAVSTARAEVSRERAKRSRDVERLRGRQSALELQLRRMAMRVDAGEATIASLRADVARSSRPSDTLRPTLLLPLMTAAVRRSAPLPLARVHVRTDDSAAFAAALAPRDGVKPAAADADVVGVAVAPSETLAEFAATPVPPDSFDPVVVAPAEAPPAAAPVEPAAAAPDVIVIGEFSLVGLAAFPRPAGMPDPGLPTVGPVVRGGDDESWDEADGIVDAEIVLDPPVIDLREDEPTRTTRGA